MSVRAVVIGATGYAGQELCALLARHPAVQIGGLFAGPSSSPRPFASLHPALGSLAGPDVEPLLTRRVLDVKADLAFVAAPHETAVAIVPDLVDAGLRVVDLSGAHRLKDAGAAEHWYGIAPRPQLLGDAVYGLSEWCGPALPGARLVANPGCYATAILLALLPVREVLDPGQAIVADACSGVSGAGKRSELGYAFTELAGNFKAYGLGGHRHEPEIRQALGLPTEAPFVFVPHLLPVVRGILATIHVAFRDPKDPVELRELYAQAYPPNGAPFVRVLPHGQTPELRDVVGTPRAHLGFVVHDGGRRAVLIAALDNLLKGAASQAVQNANGMLGLSPGAGLL